MAARLLAARGGGVGRFQPLGDGWLGEDDDATSSLVKILRKQREEVYGLTRVRIHASIPAAEHNLTELLGKPARLGFARPAQMAPLPLPMPAELAEAIDELDEVAAYAEEIEVETPTAIAFDNARRLLKAMYRISPRRYSVYPAAGGHIAIDARGSQGSIAVVSCGSDGSVLCLVTIDGEDRRARYATARTLPDGFISEALAAL